MAYLLELAHRLGRDALGGRIGRDELGMLLLERLQLVIERVVLVVADLGVVEDVVAVGVVVDRLAQLGGALPGVFARRGQRSVTSLAAGSTRRSRL
jgi:hypothetical protein